MHHYISFITAFHTVLFKFNPFRIFHATLLDIGSIRCTSCITAFLASLHFIHHCISYSVIQIQSLQDFSCYFARQCHYSLHFMHHCISYSVIQIQSLQDFSCKAQFYMLTTIHRNLRANNKR